MDGQIGLRRYEGDAYLSGAIGNAVDPIPLQAGRAVYSASSGVTNIPGVLAMATAVDYLNAIGIGAIERYNLALRQRVFTALQGVPPSLARRASMPLCSTRPGFCRTQNPL